MEGHQELVNALPLLRLRAAQPRLSQSGALRPLGGVSGSHGDRSRQGGAEQAEHRYHAGLR